MEILTIAVVVVHLRQHIHSVRIERQIRAFHNAKGIELVPKSALSKDELGGVGTVETIDAVRPADACLQRDVIAPGRFPFPTR